MNNFYIENSLSKYQTLQTETNEETLWMKNFNKKYLESDLAKYFFRHQLGIANTDETIVEIKYQSLANTGNNNIIENINLKYNKKFTIKEKWKVFVQDKIQKAVTK